MANSNFIPWGLHPLPGWIKTELEKRAAEVGMNTDLQKYAGPRTAWVRFFSNGTAPGKKFEGFVMNGVNGFDDSYGFRPDGQQVIGFDGEGTPHTILAASGNTMPNRPPPAIESIEVSLYGGQNSSFSGLCRKARVNWKCYNLDQLNYMAPYFLRPKVTALVEWGWNNYNQTSLIDLSGAGKKDMVDILLDGQKIMERIEQSSGNYDAMIGFIFDYQFTLNAQGGYDCYTEFVNANWLLEGLEYKSMSRVNKTTAQDGKTVETPMKTFVEFIGSDVNNLALTDKSPDAKKSKYDFDTKGKTFIVDSTNAKSLMAAGTTEKKIWLRMDLVQEILNRFFSITFMSISGQPVGENALVLDISDTIICGHPAIKSTNQDVLVPNQYAPRLTTIDSEIADNQLRKGSESRKSLASVSIGSGIESQPYQTLFSDAGFLSVIKSRGLTLEYDDLREIINPTGKSFPVYEKNGSATPGTWGYLKDIFVSTSLLKTAMEQNDTAYRVLESILTTINDALSGTVQLKVVSHQYAARYSVIDTNFNPKSTVASVKDLIRFVPGAVNSAYMTNAGLAVKLSPEMANQMVAQSSAGKNIDGINTRVGVQKANRFVGTDRLYEYGTVDDDTPSENSPDTPKIEYNRQISSKFNTYQARPDGKKYILVEPDADFMRSIVSDDSSGQIIYINSPMMAGTKFEMETLGISGFTFLGQFTLDHVPDTYRYDNCVWQIADIKQKVANGNWSTNITADCRPLSYVGAKPVA